MTRYVPAQEIRDIRARVATDLATLMGDYMISRDRRDLLVPGEPDWQRVDAECRANWSRLVAAAASYGAAADLLYPPLPLFFS